MNLWIVVGDAGGARLFSSTGRAEPLRLLRTLTHQRSRAKESDINTDRPGRVRKGPAAHGVYAMTPSVRPHEMEARHFAREVAGVLGSALGRHEFDSVALLAPARFLGMLRRCLDGQVRKRVLIRVDKDLTHVDSRSLRRHFSDVFQAVEEEEHRRLWSS